MRIARPNLVGAARRWWAAWPPVIRWTLVGVVGALAVPWLLGLYSAWWDFAFGAGSFLRVFAPIR